MFVPEPAVIVHPVGTVHVYVEAFETAVIEYVCPVTAGHCVAVPVIAPGVAGAALVKVIGNELADDVPHEFVAVTDTFPAVEPKETVALDVPCPAVIVAPEGIVHV